MTPPVGPANPCPSPATWRSINCRPRRQGQVCHCHGGGEFLTWGLLAIGVGVEVGGGGRGGSLYGVGGYGKGGKKRKLSVNY